MEILIFFFITTHRNPFPPPLFGFTFEEKKISRPRNDKKKKTNARFVGAANLNRKSRHLKPKKNNLEFSFPQRLQFRVIAHVQCGDTSTNTDTDTTLT